MPSFRPNSQCLLAALLWIAISGCSSSGSGNASEAPADDNTSPAPISTPGETETGTETESESPTDPQTPNEEQPAPSPGAGEPVIQTTEASFTEVDQPDWSILMREGTWRMRHRLNLFGTSDRIYPDQPEYLGTRYNIEQSFLFTVEAVSDGQVRTYHCGDFQSDTYSVPEFGARFAELVNSDDSTESGVALCAASINNRYFVAPDALRVERYCQDENVATFEFVRISTNTQFEVAEA